MWSDGHSHKEEEGGGEGGVLEVFQANWMIFFLNEGRKIDSIATNQIIYLFSPSELFSSLRIKEASLLNDQSLNNHSRLLKTSKKVLTSHHWSCVCLTLLSHSQVITFWQLDCVYNCFSVSQGHRTMNCDLLSFSSRKQQKTPTGYADIWPCDSLI